MPGCVDMLRWVGLHWDRERDAAGFPTALQRSTSICSKATCGPPPLFPRRLFSRHTTRNDRDSLWCCCCLPMCACGPHHWIRDACFTPQREGGHWWAARRSGVSVRKCLDRATGNIPPISEMASCPSDIFSVPVSTTTVQSVALDGSALAKHKSEPWVHSGF